MTQTLYKTTVKANGGRDGKIESDNGILKLNVGMPESLGGKGEAKTNPEQLFGAGYAACFDGALNLVARQKRHRISSEVNASVSLLMSEADGLNLAVELNVSVDGVEKEIAEELLALAHETCPYSKAIKNNVDVKVNLL